MNQREKKQKQQPKNVTRTFDQKKMPKRKKEKGKEEGHKKLKLEPPSHPLGLEKTNEPIAPDELGCVWRHLPEFSPEVSFPRSSSSSSSSKKFVGQSPKTDFYGSQRCLAHVEQQCSHLLQMLSSSSSSSSQPTMVWKCHEIVLPEFMSLDLWDRHKYTICDIRHTLQGFSNRQIWLLIMAYNYPILHAKIQESANHAFIIEHFISKFVEQFPRFKNRMESVTRDFTFKKAASGALNNTNNNNNNSEKDKDVKTQTQSQSLPQVPLPQVPSRHVKIQQHKKEKEKKKNSELDKNKKYCLPLHSVDSATFQTMKQSVISPSFVHSSKSSPPLFNHQGIWIVVLEVFEDVISVGRVIPRVKYEAIYGKPINLRSMPYSFTHPQTGQPWVLCKEFFFLQPLA
jgi:hypothetical protein